ncbi:MAG: SDR family NAD(P)-dependent oxidoreductase [Bacteroidetes bacterium]|nr:SDR family NAD(P)-dependent oxidoreductase [Bacteroidota bacterium]MBL6944538.1 SDR family NAD(P)-dependent oxidoreductase [Bacteroidales bacterium]
MNNKRVAIITGAYGAIGKAIAESIAKNHQYEVVLIGRDEEKLISAVHDIQGDTLNQLVRYEVVDLSRKQSVEDLSNRWEGPLHVLVNNAATTPRQRIETPDCIEMQFATNVLGYMWMINHMGKFMYDVQDSRIVNVASYWAGGLDFDDIEFKHRSYNNDTAYRQSKQANRMLSTAFSVKLSEKGIKVNACHPGDVNSKLSNNLGFGGHESPATGAATPVWLAISEHAANFTGKYFEHMQQVSCRFSNNKQHLKQLYTLCEGY